MMGILPIGTPFFTTTCLPRVYRTFTSSGAEYVQSRKRHWNGVTGHTKETHKTRISEKQTPVQYTHSLHTQ